jgi:hypothetical protein
MQVFLSYHQADESFAESLSEELQQRGLRVWRDAEGLLPGDNWASAVAKALKTSKAMVVLISPASMQSKYVRNEIQYALGDLNYEHRIFPVLVHDTPDIPWILSRFEMLKANRGAAKVGDAIADALKQVA